MSEFNMDGNRGKKAFKSMALHSALRGKITFPQQWYNVNVLNLAVKKKKEKKQSLN